MASTPSVSNSTLVVVAILALGAGVFGGGLLADSSAPVDREKVEPAPDAETMRRQIDEALRASDTLDRTLALDAALANLNAENVGGAFQALDRVLVAAHRCDVRAMLHAWARFDGEAARDHALGWSISSKRNLGVRASGMASSYYAEPLGTVAFIRSLTSVVLRDVATKGLFDAWVRRDEIDDATDYLATIPDGDSRDVYVAQLAGDIANRNGLEATIAWSEAVSPDAANDLKRTVHEAALTTVSYKRPARGAELYLARQAEPYATDTLWRVAAGWVNADPIAALGWLRARPENPDRHRALRHALILWNANEPQAMLRWLRSNRLSDAERAYLGDQFRPRGGPHSRTRKADS